MAATRDNNENEARRFVLDDNFVGDVFSIVYQKLQLFALAKQTPNDPTIHPFVIYDKRKNKNPNYLMLLHKYFKRYPFLHPLKTQLLFAVNNESIFSKKPILKYSLMPGELPLYRTPDEDVEDSLRVLSILRSRYSDKNGSITNHRDFFDDFYRYLFIRRLNRKLQVKQKYKGLTIAEATDARDSKAAAADLAITPAANSAVISTSVSVDKSASLSRPMRASDSQPPLLSPPRQQAAQYDEKFVAVTPPEPPHRSSGGVDSKYMTDTSNSRIVADFDGDGSIFNANYHDPKNQDLEPLRTINANKKLSEHLNKLVQRTKLPVTFSVNSARQSPQCDLMNMLPRQIEVADGVRVWCRTSSVYYAVTRLAEQVVYDAGEGIASSGVILDQYTLNDSFAPGVAHGSSFKVTEKIKRDDVTSYDTELDRIRQLKINDIEKSRLLTQLTHTHPFSRLRAAIEAKDNYCLYDEDKFLQLYAKMHRQASQTPEQTIDYYFYDDKEEILNKLNTLFTKYRHLRPMNVTLHFMHYAGEAPKETHVIRNSQKTPGGEIDADYESSIKQFEVIYRELINPDGYNDKPFIKSQAEELNRAYKTSKVMRLMAQRSDGSSGLFNLGRNVEKSFFTKFDKYRLARDAAQQPVKPLIKSAPTLGQRIDRVVIAPEKQLPGQRVIYPNPTRPLTDNAIAELEAYRVLRDQEGEYGRFGFFACLTKMTKTVKFSALDKMIAYLRGETYSPFTNIELEALTEDERLGRKVKEFIIDQQIAPKEVAQFKAKQAQQFVNNVMSF